MLKKTSINLFISALLIFSGCAEPPKEKKVESVTQNDSLKVFFYNMGKNQLDSLNSVISNEIMTSRGVDIRKLFQNLSEKDSMGYEYYANYAYLQVLKYNKPAQALKYLDLGAYKAKSKSRFYFDKALMWAYIQPLKERDTVYKYLDLAVRNDSLNAFYYGARSKFSNEDGNNESALRDINKAIQLDPMDTSYVNQRGAYRLVLKDYEGALKDMEHAAYRNKNMAELYMYRAMAYHKLKRYKEALEEADKCLTLNPNMAVAYSIRGNAKLHQGDEDGGIKDAKKGAELGDKDAVEFLKKYEESKRTHKEA